MYLKKTPQASGRIHLSCVHSYRDETGRVRQKTIQNFGFLDTYEGVYEDPIAHFKEVVAKMEQARKAEVQAQSIEIHPLKKIEKDNLSLRRYVGDAPICAWLDALGLERCIRNASRSLKVDFDVFSVLRLLVCQRILNPASKAQSFGEKERHFFRSDFEEHDLYRALSILSNLSDRLVAAANRSISQNTLRDESLLCYDVTNYYFECDPKGMRQKGVSKEHRPNPIVQMGLLQDKNGIPLAFELFDGNTLDAKTLIPVLAKQNEIQQNRVVVVADKGLNCSENIAACVAKGNGFIFSQSLRGTKSSSELRSFALDDAGYVSSDDGTFKIKSFQSNKKVHLKDIDTHDGKYKDVEVEVKIVCFWSKKYADRAKAARQETIDKAQNMVENRSSYTAHTNYGAAKYVQDNLVDPVTGEVLDKDLLVLSFDEDKLQKDEELDGYYLIVSSETDWSDEQIIDAYRELWRIEEAFSITKTKGLSSRPVFVWTNEHIKAHFLICYFALLIVRLMQYSLPSKPSATKLIEELRRLQCSNFDENWWLFDYRSDLSEEIFKAQADEHPTKYMKTGDIKKLYKKGKKLTWPK